METLLVCCIYAIVSLILISLTATYTLIHSFLTRQSHTKAADALKKAAKEIVVLKDGIDVEGPQLDEIVKQWKQLVNEKAVSSDSSSSDSSDDCRYFYLLN